MRYKTFYQIDYIDNKGYLNYIDTFNKSEYNKAIKHLNILNKANECISGKTGFILSEYRTLSTWDEDELVQENITNYQTLKDRGYWVR